MITLQTLLMELKPESFNEIVAGSDGKSNKTASTKCKSSKSGKSSKNKSGKQHSCGCSPLFHIGLG